MRKLNLLFITAIAVLGIVGNASAAVMNWEGTATIRLGDLADGVFYGGGVATVNGSNGGVPAHLQTLRLAGSRGNVGGDATAFVTDPEAKANLIVSVQFLGVEGGTGTFSPISGLLSSTATPGQWSGVMPLAGLVKLCLLNTNCINFGGMPLTEIQGSQTVGVGIGGLLTFTIFSGFARFSVEANPWTLKTTIVQDNQTTAGEAGNTTFVPITFKGFAHDPASGTTNTADIGGVVQLVTGAQIKSTLPAGSNKKIGAGVSLLVRFIPEPGMLLLIGSGAAGLALLGRKRMRK
ncbi:MAG: PEP-CTERM sorting domain-containing protein [Deltaproteobacteria bacterium]|nr:PEP-CTERM sorting domain-containing protein [Deltaproteobacteria bacterium]MBW2360903.1 PEP-CTERM sorting domain-containing protein [Deltaproteobacteria bacterium]